MPRLFLTSLRRRLPRWLGPVLAVLLVCQQVALATHLCVVPAGPPVAVADPCMAAMSEQGQATEDSRLAPDCAAHCASPMPQTQDLLALGVPPLPLPILALPRDLLAAGLHPGGDADDDPAARGWRAAHACTVLLI